MVRYGTQEYANAVMEALNSSTEYAEAANDWEGDFYLIAEPSGPVKEPIYFYMDLWHGKCRKAAVTNNDKDFNPEFVMSAKYDIWKKMSDGKLDGVQALVTRQMKLKGNMTKIMRNTKAANAMTNALNKLQVEWPE